ncbi:sigma-70 family RNA polymerase sigma factor [Actinorugispora endophytica]|nr:sigma-70 family RNA polymerase sigma factor [Actinorugispora endophytica]
MTDRELFRALRSSGYTAAHACGLLFDAYGEELYRHCRAALGDDDSAQSALRDTVIVARAHIGRLADPRLLREWLLALADAECARHAPVPDRFCGPRPRTAAAADAESAARPAALRVRVLSGAAAPELTGYRDHVATRADHFDRRGFPLPASVERTPGPGSYLVPGLVVSVGVLLALALVLVRLAAGATWFG